MPKSKVEKKTPANNIEAIYTDTTCDQGYATYTTILFGRGEKVLLSQRKLYTTDTDIVDLLSIVEALISCESRGIDAAIYSRNQTAIDLVYDIAYYTKPNFNCQTELVRVRIENAVSWLMENEFPNQVLKYTMTPEIQSEFDKAERDRVLFNDSLQSTDTALDAFFR